MYNIILESKNFFRMRRRRDKNVIELRIQFFLLLVYSIYVSVQHRESNNTGGGASTLTLFTKCYAIHAEIEFCKENHPTKNDYIRKWMILAAYLITFYRKRKKFSLVQLANNYILSAMSDIHNGRRIILESAVKNYLRNVI